MNKLIIGIVLGIFALGIVSAGIFEFIKKESNPGFEITDTFNKKITELNSEQLCLKDGEKIVKNSQCEKEKPKYSLVNVSNYNIYENNEGVIKID